MTWPEYERRALGYHTRQYREWERTREILTQQYNMGVDKGKQMTSRKYMPLPTDPQLRQVQNADELRAFRERMKKELLSSTL